MGTGRAKFIWPPKQVSEADLGAPSEPGYWKRQPRREPPVVETRPAAAADAMQAVSVRPVVSAARPEDGPWHPWSWRRQIEGVWFGLTRATLAERAADEDWRPDPPSAYCSKCASSVGLHEETAEGCRICRGKRLPWSRFVRLGEYQGLIREVVHEVKFTRWRRVGTDAGRLLGAQLIPFLEGLPREKLAIIPVPTTFLRRMSRGIDHTLVLARGIHEVTGGRIVRPLRRSHRPSQVGLPMTERRRNVSGTMRLRGRPALGGCTVIVIDDVRTTGATMMEACRALARGLKETGQSPTQVWAAVLGVAMDHATMPPAKTAKPVPAPQFQVDSAG
jgi:predicted amidophosphoribosyltransferase